MPISSRQVVWSVFAFLLIGFLALMAIVGTTLWLGERSKVYFDAATEGREARSAAVELRQAIQSAESGQRGFLVADNEVYLAPYDTAKAQAQRQLAELKRLVTSYPDTSVAIERLTAVMAEKFEEMDRIITLQRAGHREEALAIFQTNHGKALMDEANVFISGLVRRIEDRLNDGVTEQQLNANLLRLVSAIGALAIIAVVGGAAWTLLRYTKELRETRDEVNALNSGLEQRVAERTADLAQARDKAQLLLSEVNHRVANSLALVSSLVSLQSKGLTDPAAKQALADAQDRIFAISLVHKRLYSSGDVGVVRLDEYLAGLLDHLQSSLRGTAQGTSLTYALDPVMMPTDAGINLGVVVTEWVTNAFKYAYPDGTGEIRVRLKRLDGGRVELVVEDDGVGKVEGAPSKGTGLGTRIVTAMASGLKADIDYAQRAPGLAARFSFVPLAG